MWYLKMRDNKYGVFAITRMGLNPELTLKSRNSFVILAKLIYVLNNPCLYFFIYGEIGER